MARLASAGQIAPSNFPRTTPQKKDQLPPESETRLMVIRPDLPRSLLASHQLKQLQTQLEPEAKKGEIEPAMDRYITKKRGSIKVVYLQPPSNNCPDYFPLSCWTRQPTDRLCLTIVRIKSAGVGSNKSFQGSKTKPSRQTFQRAWKDARWAKK